MTEGIVQLVYISRAIDRRDDAIMRDIQAASTKHNASNDVTGLLLFDGGRFIQALEGPEDAVRATMNRIRADQRHDRIQIVSDRVVTARQFGSWSMQCRRTPPGSCSMTFVRRIKQAMEPVNEPALQAMFIGFAVMGITQAQGMRA